MKAFALFALCALCSCLSYAQPTDLSASDEDIARGRNYYVAACARCHGVNGNGGEGPALARAILPRAPDDDALISLIANGIPGSAMAPLWWLPEVEQRQVASFVRSLAPSGPAAQELLAGDPGAGQDLYDNSGCSVCHTINGFGTALGPDLTEVGLRRGTQHLRDSLVEPAAALPRGLTAISSEFADYLMVRVVDTQGNEITGMRMNEDSYTIQLKDIAGRVHSLDKQSLRVLEKQFDSSLMASYRDTFSSAELDDLVSYLMTLTSRD